MRPCAGTGPTLGRCWQHRSSAGSCDDTLWHAAAEVTCLAGGRSRRRNQNNNMSACQSTCALDSRHSHAFIQAGPADCSHVTAPSQSRHQNNDAHRQSSALIPPSLSQPARQETFNGWAGHTNYLISKTPTPSLLSYV